MEFFVAVLQWAGSVEAYIKDGEAAAREWLRTTGFENIDELNKSSSNNSDFMERTRVALRLRKKLQSRDRKYL